MSSKLIEIGNWLNQNEGILSFVLFILTVLLAWIAGVFKWFQNQQAKRDRAKKIICTWELFPDEENGEFIQYKFAPRFQNKTDEIIKDFWVNFSSSGFNLQILPTAQIFLFEGWNVRGESIQLVSKETYRFAPQNFLVPFEILIKLRKQNLPKHGAWLYISYGVPGASKVELDYKLNWKEIQRFMDSSGKTGERFLRYFGMTRKGFWKTRFFRVWMILMG